MIKVWFLVFSMSPNASAVIPLPYYSHTECIEAGREATGGVWKYVCVPVTKEKDE